MTSIKNTHSQFFIYDLLEYLGSAVRFYVIQASSLIQLRVLLLQPKRHEVSILKKQIDFNNHQ